MRVAELTQAVNTGGPCRRAAQSMLAQILLRETAMATTTKVSWERDGKDRIFCLV
jgi:hypothetical protein